MDEANPPQGVLLEEYRFLERLNRATAAAEALVACVRDRIPQGAPAPLQLVDFGSGSGDIPARAVQLAAGTGVVLEALCTDSSAAAVEIASRRAGPGLRFAQASVVGAEAQLGKGSFDVAHASLVLHHLGDEDVLRALASMSAVARRLMVWNDLVRDRAGCAGAWLSTALGSRKLRHDAVVSVRRSFTLDEARALAEAAGWREVRVVRVRGARFVVSGLPGQAPPARRPMLRAEEVQVARGKRTVVRGFSASAHSGQLMLVRGPNGSGKSTLLRALAGAARPAAGLLWVDRVSGPPGFLPQEGGLMNGLTASQCVRLAADVARVPRAQREDAVRDAIAMLALGGVAGRRVSALSGGERKRVAIAMSVVHRPQVLLLDEPDGELDADGRETLARLVRSVLDRGGVTVAAAHTDALLRLADEGVPLTEVRLP